MKDEKVEFGKVDIPLEDWKCKKLFEMLMGVPGYFAIRSLLTEGNRKNALITIRHEKGFTQKWLADSLGVNQSNIRSWEVLGSSIPPEYVAKITALLGITEEELFAVPECSVRSKMTREEAKEKWVASIKQGRDRKNEEYRNDLMKFFEENKSKKGIVPIAAIAEHFQKTTRSIRRMVEKNPNLQIVNSNVLLSGIAPAAVEKEISKERTSESIRIRLEDSGLTFETFVSDYLMLHNKMQFESACRLWLESDEETAEGKMLWCMFNQYLNKSF